MNYGTSSYNPIFIYQLYVDQDKKFSKKCYPNQLIEVASMPTCFRYSSLLLGLSIFSDVWFSTTVDVLSQTLPPVVFIRACMFV